MVVKLYFDEDAQDADLVNALTLRGVDVLTPAEAGMMQRSDEDQLLFATIHSRVLYSFNVRDFSVLHSDFLVKGKDHAGIMLGPQQEFSIGEQMRRLLHIVSVLSAKDMRNRIEFLANWQPFM